jgi:transcriptional regulator with XRE-family HTH domain
MPTLASIFRRRLRDAFAVTQMTQTAFAEGIQLSGSQVSRILKQDAAAGSVTIQRVDAIAAALRVPPSNFFRLSEDDAMVLTDRELEILELVRMLPDDQQTNLIAWLTYVFPERRTRKAEMAVMRQLNEARQRERDREREELRQLRKR